MCVCVCVCTQIFAIHYSYGYLKTREDMMRQKNELGANIRKDLRACTLLRNLFTTKQSSFILICMLQH